MQSLIFFYFLLKIFIEDTFLFLTQLRWGLYTFLKESKCTHYLQVPGLWEQLPQLNIPRGAHQQMSCWHWHIRSVNIALSSSLKAAHFPFLHTPVTLPGESLHSGVPCTLTGINQSLGWAAAHLNSLESCMIHAVRNPKPSIPRLSWFASCVQGTSVPRCKAGCSQQAAAQGAMEAQALPCPSLCLFPHFPLI